MDIKTVLKVGPSLVGSNVTVAGWVKTGRLQEAGTLAFLELNDGSTPSNFQVLVNKDIHDVKALQTTGTSVVVTGEIKAHPKKEGEVEMHATAVPFVGPCDGAKYPLAKGKHPLEHLRSIAHLRSRSNIISSVARVRNALAFATHRFFQENGFLYVHTPLITASDCEGAGEMFQVTTMLGQVDPEKANSDERKAAQAQLQDLEKKTEMVTAQLASAKEGGDKKAIKKKTNELNSTEAELQGVRRAANAGDIPRKSDGTVDYTDDFFGKASYLTVSGQLNVETYAVGLSSVYTFGPTFRAENSNTVRHLAEFWMIEPEIAFADIWDDMRCAEDYVRYCCQYLLDHCYADMEFFAARQDPGCIERIQNVIENPFQRLSYTDAITLLQKVVADGHKFEENEIVWGMDLGSEHERYICEVVYKKPTIVYDYPKDIKAFYMKLNDDNKTVAAMDILVPKVGELIGGSEREYRMEVLDRRMAELSLDPADYSWYLDLRRYGTCVHSGFGLGFERLILFTTGMENIRDVIPFPRYPGHAEY
jgi:asparaginyl-tRNA synthetase